MNVINTNSLRNCVERSPSSGLVYTERTYLSSNSMAVLKLPAVLHMIYTSPTALLVRLWLFRSHDALVEFLQNYPEGFLVVCIDHLVGSERLSEGYTRRVQVRLGHFCWMARRREVNSGTNGCC